jgi:hypothetical protein
MKAITRKHSVRRKSGPVVLAVVALFLLLVIFAPTLFRWAR